MKRTFKRFVQFSKLDDDFRSVLGTATVEEIDKQEEVVSFAGAKKAFEAHADYFVKASQGKSKGNVREMHQPIAAGRIVEWEPDDKAKAIRISTKIDDDDAWKKCKAGTYIGFSIGGNPTKEHKEKIGGREVNVIDEFDLIEVSLVDNPACPDAVFDVVKIAGGESEPAPSPTPEPAPAEPAPAPAPAPEAMKAEDPTTVQTLIFSKDKFDSADAAKKWAKDHDFRADKVDETDDSFRLRQRDPGDFKQESFRTISLKDGVQAVVGHLKLATPRFGKVAKALAPLVRKLRKNESMSIYPALCALSDCHRAMESEAFGMAMGSDPGQEKADIETLAAAVDALLKFLGEEFAQEIREWTSAESPGQAVPFGYLNNLQTMSKALSVFQLKKLLDDEEMQENLAAIHRMGHGLVKASSVMGASCPDGECEEKVDEPEPGTGEDAGTEPGEGGKEEREAEGKPAGKAAAPAPRSKDGKLVDEIRKVGSDVNSVKETVAGFDARLKKIESQPAPIGRPAAPVDKQIAPGTTAVTVADDAATLKRLADAEIDPERKRVLTMLSVEKQIKQAQVARGAQ